MYISICGLNSLHKPYHCKYMLDRNGDRCCMHTKCVFIAFNLGCITDSINPSIADPLFKVVVNRKLQKFMHGLSTLVLLYI